MLVILMVLAGSAAHAATYTVSKIADTNDGVCDADCSLREGIAAANATAADDTIVFDAAVFASAQTINLSGSQLVVNDAASTGTLLIYNAAGATNLRVSGNNLSRVFFVSGANLTLSGLTISGGNSNNGGGINNGGTLTVINSTISGNSSNDGGGISSGGAMTVTNSTISGNSGSNAGGGISNGSTMTVTNSTISGNSARSGGGIYTNTTATVTLTNSTITGNSATSSGGGGISIVQGVPNIRNMIIAGNISFVGDVQGLVNSQGYNLIGNPGGANITGDTTGNILGQNAQLAPLGFYGGQTMTHALLANSPAINAGSNALAVDGNNQPLTTDQRGTGFARIRGATVDIGAFEGLQPLSLSVDTTSDNGSLTACTAAASDCSLRGAISRANSSSGDDTISFDATVFATGQTITLGGSELSINNNGSLTINGTGVNLLHINGNNQSRVFLINPNSYVAISGMTVRNGNGVGAFSGYGGGIANSMGNLTLTAVTVSNSTATADGGGIAADGVTTLVNSSVNGNSANSSGGGIASSTGGTLNITNSTVNGNTAGFINGGIVSTGIMTITGSTISNNTCLGTIGSTGGIGVTNDTVITNSTISGNTMPNGTNNSGGAIWANGNLTVINSTITDNQGFDIGGIRNAGSATFILTNTIVAGNRNSATVPEVIGAFTANNNLIGNAGTATGFTGNGNLTNANALLLVLGNYGGTTQTHALAPTSPAINAGTSVNAPTLDQRGKARIGATDIGSFEAPANLLVINTGNAAGSLREAITTANATTADESISFGIPTTDAGCTNGVCTINLSGSQLVVNDAASTGTLLIYNAAGATNLRVSGNNQSRVFFVNGANLTLSGLTISGGNSNNGGGIYNGGTLTVINSTISGNSSSSYGGGINNGGTLTVTNSTISGNSASTLGGGIGNISGTLTVANSTISGNSAFNGGGIYTATFATVTLTNSTISGNSAVAFGGGITIPQGVVPNIRNMIIAGNIATNGDVQGTVNSQGYNLIGNAASTIINGDITGNILNQNARLAPLGFYGGTTQTHALLSGSPAINAGTSTNTPTLDQRGAARVGNVDMGAFELNNSANGGNYVAELPNGQAGMPYIYTLVPNNGAFTYSQTGGTLPNGIALNTMIAPNAVVSLGGTSMMGGIFNFTVTATDGTNSNVTNYRVQFLAPVAASVTVSGKVMAQDGRGIRNAIVTMTDASGNIRSYRTSSFGYFTFDEVEVGQTYVFQVQSKRFTFAPQAITINDELTELNFTAQP